MGINRTGLLVLVGIILSTVVVSTSRAQDKKPDIQISARPGEPPGTIIVPFESGGDKATVPIFIGLEGSSPLENVSLYGQLTDCHDRPLTIGVVQFLQADADQPLGPLSLEPATGQQRAHLSVEDLGDRFGEICGYIAAEVSGRHYKYNDLRVERPAKPTLAIQEANNDQIQLVTHLPDLKQIIFISEIGGKAGVKNLQITFSPLRSEAGETMTVRQPSHLSLEANSSKSVFIEGDVPNVDTYKGILRLEWADQSQEYILVIERKVGPQTVSIEEVAPVSRTRWPMAGYLSDFLMISGLEIPLTLRETAGAATEVYYPALTKLSHLNKDGSETEAQYIRRSYRDCENRSQIKPGTNGQEARLSFASYQTRCLRLVIQGLTKPGQYKANLTLSAPSGAEQKREIIIRLRHPWLIVALVILAGVYSSYRLRHWLAVGRPTRLAKITIARLVTTVETKIPDDNDPIRQALVKRLDELSENLDVDPTLDVDARLEEIRMLLNDYLPVYAVLHLELTETLPDPHDQQEAKTRINDLRELLAQLDPLAHLTKAKTQAENLQADIKKWNQTRLTTALTKLGQAIDNDITALDKLAIPDNKREELKQKLTNLKTIVPDGEQVKADFQTTQAAYEHVRTAYAELSIERLHLVLEGQEQPAGFQKQDWETTRNELLTRLNDTVSQAAGDIEILEQAVAKVRQAYLSEVIARLKEEGEDFVIQYQAIPDQQDQVTKMQAAVNLLGNQAELQLKEGDLDEAEKTYDKAAKQYIEALPEQRRGQIQAAGGMGAAGAPAPTPGAGSDPGGPVGKEVAVPGQVTESITIQKQIKEIRKNDLYIMYMIMFVSVVVGILVLWVPNATFGDPADYIAAFLWGFGLHELNKLALPAAASSLPLQLPSLPVGNSQTDQPPK